MKNKKLYSSVYNSYYYVYQLLKFMHVTHKHTIATYVCFFYSKATQMVMVYCISFDLAITKLLPSMVLKPLLSFLFNWWMKRWDCWRGIDELYGLSLLHHTNGQTHVCLIASPVKIINKSNALPCTDSSQPGWFQVETYVYECSWAVICAPAMLATFYHIDILG